MIPFVDRIQINFCYKDNQVQELDQLCNKYPDKTFITQHNKANEDLWKKIIAFNHQILFDTSGGRAIVCENWPNPLNTKICGYAGGLGPDNIHLPGISEKHGPFRSVMDS